MLQCFFLIMVDSCFIINDCDVKRCHLPHDTSSEDSYRCTVLCMLLQELFLSPSCTNFMEVKSAMDDIDKIITNLQLFCHFINSHPFFFVLFRISEQIC